MHGGAHFAADLVDFQHHMAAAGGAAAFAAMPQFMQTEHGYAQVMPVGMLQGDEHLHAHMVPHMVGHMEHMPVDLEHAMHPSLVSHAQLAQVMGDDGTAGDPSDYGHGHAQILLQSMPQHMHPSMMHHHQHHHAQLAHAAAQANAQHYAMHPNEEYAVLFHEMEAANAAAAAAHAQHAHQQDKDMQ